MRSRRCAARPAPRRSAPVTPRRSARAAASPAVRWRAPRRPAPAAPRPRTARTTRRCRRASCPCWRATSSMRYVNPCGTGVLECRSNRACNSLAVRRCRARAGSTLADAVHHRRARRFHGRHRGQLLGQLAFQRAGTITVRSACSRKWSIGLGSTFAIAATTSSASPPAGRAPGWRSRRGHTPSACASASRSRPAPAAAAPPSAAAARSSPATPRSRRHRPPAAGRPAPGAAVAGPAARRWSTANPTGPHRVCRPARGCRSARPPGQIQPGRGQQMPPHRRRRFDEAVGGHRRRPVRAGAVGWLRFGRPAAISPAAADTSRIRPSLSSMPVTLAAV